MDPQPEQGEGSVSHEDAKGLQMLAEAAVGVTRLNMAEQIAKDLKATEDWVSEELKNQLEQQTNLREQVDNLSDLYQNLLRQQQGQMFLALQLSDHVTDIARAVAEQDVESINTFLASAAETQRQMLHLYNHSIGFNPRARRTPTPAAQEPPQPTKTRKPLPSSREERSSSKDTLKTSPASQDPGQRRIKLTLTNKGKSPAPKRKLRARSEKQQAGNYETPNKRRKKNDGTKEPTKATQSSPAEDDDDEADEFIVVEDSTETREDTTSDDENAPGPSNRPVVRRPRARAARRTATATPAPNASATATPTRSRYKTERRRDQTSIPINGDPNNFFLCKKNKGTLLDGWSEWHRGYTHPEGHVNPPLKELEDQFGSRWRSGEDVKFRSTYVTRRKLVADATARLAETYNITEEEMINRLEQHVGPGRSEAAAAILGRKDGTGDPLNEMVPYEEHKADIARRKTATRAERRQRAATAQAEDDDEDEDEEEENDEDDT